MPGSGTALFFLTLLIIASVLERLTARARVPASVMLVPLGFVASEIVTRGFDIDLGIRWDNLRTLIGNFIVPSLVFHAATRLDLAAARREGLNIFLLSVPLLLIAAGISATLLYFGIGHPAGFPWLAAFLTGVILCSTEMTGLFRHLAAAAIPGRVVWLLEGESIFNDTAALVLFMFIIMLIFPGGAETGGWNAPGAFLRLALGGVLVGTVAGFVGCAVLRLSGHEHAYTLVTLTGAYAVYMVAQDVLGVSGALAVLVAGLLISKWPGPGARVDEVMTLRFWDFAGHLAGSLVFLLAGASITLVMFRDQWLAMIIGIVAVLAARFVIVFGLLGPLAYLPRRQTFSVREQFLLCWCGVRGSVAMALALSLPLELESWYTVQSIVYGVVLFSIFVQATSIPRLTRRDAVGR